MCKGTGGMNISMDSGELCISPYKWSTGCLWLDGNDNTYHVKEFGTTPKGSNEPLKRHT